MDLEGRSETLQAHPHIYNLTKLCGLDGDAGGENCRWCSMYVSRYKYSLGLWCQYIIFFSVDTMIYTTVSDWTEKFKISSNWRVGKSWSAQWLTAELSDICPWTWQNGLCWPPLQCWWQFLIKMVKYSLSLILLFLFHLWSHGLGRSTLTVFSFRPC